MTDTVVEKAAGAVDLQTKAVALVDQLTAGLKAVAPQMADLTLAAIRIEAIVNLLVCIGWTVFAGIAAYWVYRWFHWVHSWPRQSATDKDYTVRGVIAFVAGCLGCCFLAIMQVIACIGLVSTPMWVAIIDPRLALALRVINRLM